MGAGSETHWGLNLLETSWELGCRNWSRRTWGLGMGLSPLQAFAPGAVWELGRGLPEERRRASGLTIRIGWRRETRDASAPCWQEEMSGVLGQIKRSRQAQEEDTWLPFNEANEPVGRKMRWLHFNLDFIDSSLSYWLTSTRARTTEQLCQVTTFEGLPWRPRD